MNAENQFNKPLPPADLTLRSKDHPEANGRQPENGDLGYNLVFPLDDGRTLHLMVGVECFSNFRAMLQQMDADDAAERLLG